GSHRTTATTPNSLGFHPKEFNSNPNCYDLRSTQPLTPTINFSLSARPPPNATLFPYTTLFRSRRARRRAGCRQRPPCRRNTLARDRKSTRLNSSHQIISYAVFCLKKKNQAAA